jgi:hypothetical protein
VEAYNRSVGSWDARLVPALRKMHELGVANGEEPQAPEQIDLLARRPRLIVGRSQAGDAGLPLSGAGSAARTRAAAPPEDQDLLVGL